MLENYAGMWTWGVFLWMILTLGAGIGVTLLIRWIRQRRIKVAWYDWLLWVIGFALLAFTIQNFYAAFQEKVVRAAYMFLLLPGVPAILLLTLPTVRILMGRKKIAT
ncbi:MAG: dehalogenase [Dehalogenimonas sp.]